MTVLAGGIIALVLGLILLIVWWSSFITVLAGAIPILLLVGGALAAYLGLEEMKDRQQMEREMAAGGAAPPAGPSQADLEAYKKETEKYKAEVEELKKKLAEGEKKEKEKEKE